MRCSIRRRSGSSANTETPSARIVRPSAVPAMARAQRGTLSILTCPPLPTLRCEHRASPPPGEPRRPGICEWLGSVGSVTTSPRRHGVVRLARDAFRDFLDDGCPSLAAALSYYTVFSLPPFLVVLMLLLGAVLDPEDVRGALERQIESLVGPAGGEIARNLLREAEQPAAGGLVATLLGASALILGATGALGQLQLALNRVWEVKPDPAQGGVKNFVGKRAFSLLLLIGVAFFLLVSLAVSAVVSALGDRMSGGLPGDLSEPLLHTLDFAFSFGVITLLFAAMLKIIPDARIAWRDVWVGAVATTLLFVLGKFLIGFYLGRSNPGEAYGAAASLAVLLVWVYYASMILLLGAEFTQIWAHRGGQAIAPEPGAVEVHEEERRGRAAQTSRKEARSEPTEASPRVRRTESRQLASAQGTPRRARPGSLSSRILSRVVRSTRGSTSAGPCPRA